MAAALIRLLLPQGKRGPADLTLFCVARDRAVRIRPLAREQSIHLKVFTTLFMARLGLRGHLRSRIMCCTNLRACQRAGRCVQWPRDRVCRQRKLMSQTDVMISGQPLAVPSAAPCGLLTVRLSTSLA
jgi:hypothetical protein